MLDAPPESGGRLRQADGLMQAFAARNLVCSGPLMAVSPSYVIGNWAAQALLGSIDLARVARVAHSGSKELGCITVFEALDAGYLIELDAAGPRTRSNDETQCRDDAFDIVLPGSSKAIANTRRNAVRIARHTGHVLVSGEPGTGKRSLGEHLLGTACMPAVVIDIAAESGGWLARLRAALETNRCVVLQHAQAMTPDPLPECLQLLELASARGLRVVLTVTPNLPLRLHALAARMTWRLWIPPLRDRPEDIPEIIANCPTTRRSRPRRASAATLRWLWSRPWPGNVRELLQALDHPAELRGNADAFSPSKQMSNAAQPDEPRALVQAIQKRALVQTLARCRGNRSRAAVMLGLSRATLYRKMDQFGINDTAGSLA